MTESCSFLTAGELTGLLPPATELNTLAATVLARGAEPPANFAARWTGAAAAGRSGEWSALLAGPGGPARLAVEAAALHRVCQAATTAASALRLADPQSEVITLLGCNDQGRLLMRQLLAAFPHTERMLCFDPDISRQNAFADEIMTTHDLASIIPPEPREATEGAHILVATMQPQPAQPMVEPEWLQTGTFCVLLDGDGSFTAATIAHADRRFVDDRAAFRAAVAAGRLAGTPEPEEELAAVLAGGAAGRGPGTPIHVSLQFGQPALAAAVLAALLPRPSSRNR